MSEPIDCDVAGYVSASGSRYALGSPVDSPCALCYFEGSQLVPVDDLLDGELMGRLFPVAEGLVERELGEVRLARTAQTLTLVGDVEGDEEEEGEEEDEGGEEDEDVFVNEDDGEEEVEMMLSFEFDAKEYHLVRMLDPVMLVGRADPEGRVELLGDEEGERVLPLVERAFVEATEGRMEEIGEGDVEYVQ
ncbi:hypothetical protein TeGR_g5049 [Tetraparma gracilis]|uniref:DUF3727 domain-containing protein n=1 Tax=Tetraparma gracilis TaxID=2962635 RepID=A0ABQ6N508_9STRA|nr:hypothetical protein TeGR_g5049 [Tetraparma gracilis]